MSREAALRAGSMAGRLVDRFGRVHTDLRISVTDRCNLRCTYCMPEEVVFRPREELLTYEEITRVVGIVAGLGIRTIRLTGGEPLVRRDLSTLVGQLVEIPGIDEVALTTNGLLLAEQADALRAAGLTRLNVSLDSLRTDVFEKIARRQGLDRVLAGLEAARQAGFAATRSAGFGISRPAGFAASHSAGFAASHSAGFAASHSAGFAASAIRINAVSIRGLTEDEIVPLAEFCRREGFHLRFIEFMPLDADEGWERPQVLSGAEVREILETSLGPLTPVADTDPGQPAVDYAWADGGGRVGFINPVTQPFCDRCDRLRLTADGQFRNCLFSTVEWDVRGLLRGSEPGDDAAIAALVRDCVAAKKAAHGIDTPAFERPARAMYQIGG